MAATDKHAIIEELLEVMFSVRSLPWLDNEDQLPLEMSFETAVRRVGGWCEMTASLGVSQWVGVSCLVSECRGTVIVSCCC
jgi:hypothetical protein